MDRSGGRVLLAAAGKPNDQLPATVYVLGDGRPQRVPFDAVIAGQAWHWVDPVAGAAKAAQVLRPGGRLAVFWQVNQPPPEVADAFVAVCQLAGVGAAITPWGAASRCPPPRWRSPRHDQRHLTQQVRLEG